MASSVFMALKRAIYASRADAGIHAWVELGCPASPPLVRQLLPTVQQLLKQQEQAQEE